MRSLGRVVRELREMAGRERAQLAAAAQISVTFLVKIEQGRRGTSPATLARLASALGVGTQELVTRAALLDASSAATPQEMRQATLKAAAANPALLSGLGLLGLGPLGLPGGAVSAAAAAFQRASHRTGTSRHPDAPPASGISPRQARELLIARIQAMTDEQVVMTLQNLPPETGKT